MAKAHNFKPERGGTKMGQSRNKTVTLALKYTLHMLKYIFLLVLGVFSLCFSAQAQSSYEAAKNQFKAGDFLGASAAFEKLLRQPSSRKGLREHAGYMAGLSYYKTGNYTKARRVLQEVLETNPSWGKIDEVRYLLALVAFEEGRSTEALRQLNELRNSAFKAPGENLKRRFLPQEDVFRLQKQYLTYPEDRILAECLADKLQQENAPGKAEILKEIESKFAYTPKAVSKKSVKKERYSISALLPLYIQAPEQQRRMQFAYDLWAGMQVAASELEEKGMPVDLFVYDTERSASKMQKVLNQSGIEGTDLFVGPFYSETLPILRGYAAEKKIPVVNPLSSNTDLLNEEEDYFLFTPSEQTQATQMAEFAIDSLQRPNAYILYGEHSRDSSLAFAYRDAVVAAGGRVMLMHKVETKESRLYRKLKTILEPIAPEPPKLSLKESEEMDSEEREEFLRPKEDTTAHVFISSRGQTEAAAVLSVLQRSRIDYPTFGNIEWLDYTQINLDDFDESKMYLRHPDFIPTENAVNERAFYRSFLERYGYLPSRFAVKGYEMLYYFAERLHEEGTGFSEGLPFAPPYTPKLLQGVSFGEKKDNQVFPVVQIREGKLVPGRVPEPEEEEK